MQEPSSVMIHEFEANKLPVHLDDEGEQMIGFYFQFVDGANRPLGGLVGPYGHNGAAEEAAQHAFNKRDF